MGKESWLTPAAARLLREEGGFTLIELLVVMVISLLIGAAALMAIQTGSTSTAKTSARQEAVQQAEVALARITQETRQAAAAAVRTSARLELKTRVRIGGGASQLRRVLYDCSQGSACMRTDCGSTTDAALPVTMQACSGTSTTVVRGIDQVTFGAELQGTPVAVGSRTSLSSPVFDLVTVAMRVRLDDHDSGRQAVDDLDPVEIQGGAQLENILAP